MIKKTGFLLILLGLVVVIIVILADIFSWDKDGGLGAFQLTGFLIGVWTLLCGIGLLTVKQDGKISTQIKIRDLSEKVLNWPSNLWIFLSFLVVYVLFFLFPLFFTQLKIHYFTKYIPDAYITHIGFDLEAFVSRIQDWLVTGQSPYSDGFIAYPPLAIVAFSPLIIIGYPAYFKLITGLTLAAYIVAALLIPLFINCKKNQALLVLMFITGLFSYGLQFEQERGQFNLSAFTLCLLAIYLYHYHYKFRFFAYLLFTLSIQLKVYPVIFVVMFIRDWKDWKGIMKRFLGLGFLNLSLLFILGHQFFQNFIRAITTYQFEYESSRLENLSIKGYSYYLATDSFNLGSADLLIPPEIFMESAEIFYLSLVGLSFLAVIISAFIKQSRGINPYLLIICTLSALVIPSVSNDYKLSILIAPMTIVLSHQTEISGTSRKIARAFLVILASLAYWSTFYPATVKPDFLDRNFPALIMILFSVTLLNFLVPYTDENTLH